MQFNISQSKFTPEFIQLVRYLLFFGHHSFGMIADVAKITLDDVSAIIGTLGEQAAYKNSLTSNEIIVGLVLKNNLGLFLDREYHWKQITDPEKVWVHPFEEILKRCKDDTALNPRYRYLATYSPSGGVKFHSEQMDF
jgi:hypothetical protein